MPSAPDQWPHILIPDSLLSLTCLSNANVDAAQLNFPQSFDWLYHH